MKLTLERNKPAVIAAACGVLCAACVGMYMADVDGQAHAAQSEMLARYGGDQVEVCVAKRDIAAGQTISDGDVETKMWIATLLPADAVTAKADAVGQQVGSSILAGEVVSQARFGFASSSIEVPDGMVALSVPARAVQAVGGALAPGMSVDVYAVGANATARIASSAPVLETCADAASASSASWVTLALAPEKVPEMVSAAESMELYFVLPSATAASQEGAVREAAASSSAARSSQAASSQGASSQASSQGSSAAASSSSAASSSASGAAQSSSASAGSSRASSSQSAAQRAGA